MDIAATYAPCSYVARSAVESQLVTLARDYSWGISKKPIMSTQTSARESVPTPVPAHQVHADAGLTPHASTSVRADRPVTTRTRPGGVVLIAVLAWIGAVAETLSGILVLTGILNRVNVSTETAWIAIVVGVVSFVISFFLFTGSNVARILMTISFVVSLLTSIFAVITHPADFVGLIASGLGAVIGLALLYTRRANAYFAR